MIKRSGIIGLLIAFCLTITGCGAEVDGEKRDTAEYLPGVIEGYSIIFEPAGPYTSFSALVKNPNTDVALEMSSFEITGLAEDGSVVEQLVLTTSAIEPGGQGILAGTFQDKVSEVEILADVQKYSNTAQASIVPQLEMSNLDFEYYSHYDAGDAKASFKIPSDALSSVVKACAAIFDKKGKFLSADCALKDVVLGRKNRPSVYVTLPAGTKPDHMKFFVNYSTD
jgi:hypothetical protein